MNWPHCKHPEGTVIIPSAPTEAIARNRWVSPVYNDHRSFSVQGSNYKNALGIPHDVVRTLALENGMADFDDGFTYQGVDYSAEDRVALYCYSTARMHAFELLRTLLLAKIPQPRGTTLVIDIGCGPATSALTFAEWAGANSLVWCGSDHSKCMTKSGAKLLSDVKGLKGGPLSIAHGDQSFWIGADADLGPQVKLLATWPKISIRSVIVVFSYLFAARSLADEGNRQRLASTLAGAFSVLPNLPLHVVYTNGTEEVSNSNWLQFQREYSLQEFNRRLAFGVQHAHVKYRNRADEPIRCIEYTADVLEGQTEDFAASLSRAVKG